MTFLRVSILSYNRPVELQRSLNSLLPLPACTEVVVFDDCSPKIKDIRSVFIELAQSENRLKLIERDKNVGFDRNLLESIVYGDCTFCLLLSDDDWLEPGALVNLVEQLKKSSPAAAFIRFTEFVKASDLSGNPLETRITRRNFRRERFFTADEFKESGGLLYLAILFSGLVFRASDVKEVSKYLAYFDGSIFTQVAAFSVIGVGSGVHFLPGPGVVIGGDGENGFGVNDAAGSRDRELSDRRRVFTNLKFNRRLIELVRKISGDLHPSFRKSFFRTFNLRSLSGLMRARLESRNHFAVYWREYRAITEMMPYRNYVVAALLYLLPTFLTKTIFRLRTLVINRIEGI